MKKKRKEGKVSVGKMRDKSHQYVEDLLSEKQHLQQEKARLQEQLLKLQEQLDRYEGEQVSLGQQVNHIEAESGQFAQPHGELEEQNHRLINIYVAIYRLSGSLARDEVLTVIEDILVNLVGAEEIGIFELNSDKSALSLVASSGIDAERFGSISLGLGIIGRTALTGEAYFGRGCSSNDVRSVDEADLIACIPLKVEEKVTGAIAVFRLLSHKPALEDVDIELFDVLSTQAATSLHSARFHAKSGGGVGGKA